MLGGVREGGQHPARTTGIGRVVDEGCQFLAAAPGYPAGGWVVHLNANWY
jgi:hypothetical protein